MSDIRKRSSDPDQQWQAGSLEFREAERPPGWKYKSWKIGPVKIPWYASPESQLILVSFVCFLCPGMFNAVNGLGGGGQVEANAYASNAANCALYATFAVVGFFAGTITNALGIKTALSFGGIGYCVYIGAYLCWNHTENFGYIVFSGVLLGCCAGVLWSAQGAIMMSYPPEHLKGRYISWFWVIFNLGAVIGSVVELGLNIDKENNERVSDATYIAFLILTFLGAVLSWTLVDAKHVIRRDGSKVILMKHPTWKTEIIGLWETLWSDPYIVLLFPMFFASNWFYTYQFQDVNLARFNTRTRALNSTLYWLAQMFGALIFGFALDFPNVRRTTRAKISWVVMFVLTFAVWGGGYVFQRQYKREPDHNKDGDKYDWTSSGYIGPMFLYIMYGFYDAAWQKVQVYGSHHQQQSKARQLCRVMNLFASCWILLAGSLVVALPVMILKIKDTVPVEEDLQFTDETIEDVIGFKTSYEYPDSAAQARA